MLQDPKTYPGKRNVFIIRAGLDLAKKRGLDRLKAEKQFIFMLRLKKVWWCEVKKSESNNWWNWDRQHSCQLAFTSIYRIAGNCHKLMDFCRENIRGLYVCWCCQKPTPRSQILSRKFWKWPQNLKIHSLVSFSLYSMQMLGKRSMSLPNKTLYHDFGRAWQWVLIQTLLNELVLFFTAIYFNHDIIAERLSARLLILQCMFSVGGVWCHASGIQFVTP